MLTSMEFRRFSVNTLSAKYTEPTIERQSKLLTSLYFHMSSTNQVVEMKTTFFNLNPRVFFNQHLGIYMYMALLTEMIKL